LFATIEPGGMPAHAVVEHGVGQVAAAAAQLDAPVLPLEDAHLLAAERQRPWPRLDEIRGPLEVNH
jgi:hypothetical protein